MCTYWVRLHDREDLQACRGRFEATSYLLYLWKMGIGRAAKPKMSRPWEGRASHTTATPCLALPSKKEMLSSTFYPAERRKILEMFRPVQTLVWRYLPCLPARNGGLRLLSVPSLQNFAACPPTVPISHLEHRVSGGISTSRSIEHYPPNPP